MNKARLAKFARIGILVTLLALLAVTVLGYNNPLDTAMYRLDSFTRNAPYSPYSQIIEFVLFFVIFTSVYYIGASWALQKQKAAGAGRAIIAMSAALGAITTIALVSFTDHALALLYPFAKNILFFIVAIFIYGLLIKLGMEEKKFWAAVVAFVITFLMFNASNWFICEFVPNSSGPNPQDVDRTCPITDIIVDTLRPQIGASGGFSGLWGGGGSGGSGGGTSGGNGKDIDPLRPPGGYGDCGDGKTAWDETCDPNDDSTKLVNCVDLNADLEYDYFTGGQTMCNSKCEYNTKTCKHVKPNNGNSNNPRLPKAVTIGSSITGFWDYKELNKFAYQGFPNSDQKLWGIAWETKSTADQTRERSVISEFAKRCTDAAVGGVVNIVSQTNEVAFFPNVDKSAKSRFDYIKTQITAANWNKKEDAANIVINPAVGPANRFYTISCVKSKEIKSNCADYATDSSKDCDPNNKAAKSIDCTKLDAKKYKSGTATCDKACTWDKSDCVDLPTPSPPPAGSLCGNGKIDGSEACDPGNSAKGIKPNFKGETCASKLGASYKGDLSCVFSCSIIDTTGCSDGTKPTPKPNDDSFVKKHWWKGLIALLLLGGIFFIFRRRIGGARRRRKRRKALAYLNEKNPLNGIIKKLNEIYQAKKHLSAYAIQIRHRRIKFIKEQVTPYYRDVNRKSANGRIDLAYYWDKRSLVVEKTDEFGQQVNKIRKEILGSNGAELTTRRYKPENENFKNIMSHASKAHWLKKEGDISDMMVLAGVEHEYVYLLDRLSRIDVCPPSVKKVLSDVDTTRNEFRNSVFERNPMDVAGDIHNLAENAARRMSDVDDMCIRILRYVVELIGNNHPSWKKETWLSRLLKSIDRKIKLVTQWTQEAWHESRTTLHFGKSLVKEDTKFGIEMVHKFEKLKSELKDMKGDGTGKEKYVTLMGHMILSLASPDTLEKTTHRNEDEIIAWFEQEYGKLFKEKTADVLREGGSLKNKSIIIQEVGIIGHIIKLLDLQMKQIAALIKLLEGHELNEFNEWVIAATEKVSEVDEMWDLYVKNRTKHGNLLPKLKTKEERAKHHAEVQKLIDRGYDLRAASYKGFTVGNIEKSDEVLEELRKAFVRSLILWYQGWSKEVEMELEKVDKKYNPKGTSFREWYAKSKGEVHKEGRQILDNELKKESKVENYFNKVEGKEEEPVEEETVDPAVKTVVQTPKTTVDPVENVVGPKDLKVEEPEVKDEKPPKKSETVKKRWNRMKNPFKKPKIDTRPNIENLDFSPTGDPLKNNRKVKEKMLNEKSKPTAKKPKNKTFSAISDKLRKNRTMFKRPRRR